MESSIKNKKQKVMILLTIILTGLVAGLMYAFSCAINPGLQRLQDKEYLSAMQSINIAILNPLFFLSFMGLLVVFPVAIYQLRQQPTTAFHLMITATVVYVICVFGVTVAGNIPLNNKLAHFHLSTASQSEIANMRNLFEKPWNKYHSIRTISSLVTFVLSILSLTKL